MAPLTPHEFTTENKVTYDLGLELGRGANGVVLLATRQPDGAQFAAKISLTSQEMTSQEIQVSATLSDSQSPYLAHVLNRSTLPDGRSVAIMELCGGGMLFNYVIEKVTLEEEEVQSLFRQIVEGLGTAHALGVAHRDLKLENLLLTRDLRTAKIGDFGLAVAINTVSETTHSVLNNTRCGSLAYAAPELLAGVPYNPFAADMWSLGICLSAMLFGRVPFQAATDKDQHFAKFKLELNQGKPNILDALGLKGKCSPEAIMALKACLTPDPEERATVEVLKEMPWACLGRPTNYPKVASSLAGGSTEPLMRHLGWAIPDVRLDAARAELAQAITTAGMSITITEPGLFTVGDDGEIQVSVNYSGKNVKVEWSRNQATPFQMKEVYQKVRACFEEIRGHRLASNFKPSDRKPESSSAGPTLSSLAPESSSLGKRNATSDDDITRSPKIAKFPQDSKASDLSAPSVVAPIVPEA